MNKEANTKDLRQTRYNLNTPKTAEAARRSFGFGSTLDCTTDPHKKVSSAENKQNKKGQSRAHLLGNKSKLHRSKIFVLFCFFMVVGPFVGNFVRQKVGEDFSLQQTFEPNQQNQKRSPNITKMTKEKRKVRVVIAFVGQNQQNSIFAFW